MLDRPHRHKQKYNIGGMAATTFTQGQKFSAGLMIQPIQSADLYTCGK